MENNFAYDEFNPHNKNGKPSSTWKIFKATNKYFNRSKGFKRFAIIYILLITALVFFNVGAIYRLTSTALNLESYGILGKIASNVKSTVEKVDSINSIADLNKIEDSDIEKIVEIEDLSNSDVDEMFNFSGFRIVKEIFLYLHILKIMLLFIEIIFPILNILLITHINKWVFKMNRSAKYIFEGFISKAFRLFILNTLASIALIIFSLPGLMQLFLASDNTFIFIFAISYLVLLCISILLITTFASHLFLTNKHIGMWRAIGLGCQILAKNFFNFIFKLILIILVVLFLITISTIAIVIASIKVGAPYLISFVSIPITLCILYGAIFIQMLITDYVSQYEYIKRTVIRDYDYYNVCDDESMLSEVSVLSLDANTSYRKRYVNNIKERFKKSSKKLKENSSDKLKASKKKLGEIKDKSTQKISSTFEASKETFGKIKDKSSEKLADTFEASKETFGKIKDKSSEKLADTFEASKETFGKIKDKSSEKLTDTFEASKETFSKIKDKSSEKFIKEII